jgi:hypothetical protein
VLRLASCSSLRLRLHFSLKVGSIQLQQLGPTAPGHLVACGVSAPLWPSSDDVHAAALPDWLLAPTALRQFSFWNLSSNYLALSLLAKSSVHHFCPPTSCCSATGACGCACCCRVCVGVSKVSGPHRPNPLQHHQGYHAAGAQGAQHREHLFICQPRAPRISLSCAGGRAAPVLSLQHRSVACAKGPSEIYGRMPLCHLSPRILVQLLMSTLACMLKSMASV